MHWHSTETQEVERAFWRGEECFSSVKIFPQVISSTIQGIKKDGNKRSRNVSDKDLMGVSAQENMCLWFAFVPWDQRPRCVESFAPGYAAS